MQRISIFSYAHNISPYFLTGELSEIMVRKFHSKATIHYTILHLVSPP